MKTDHGIQGRTYTLIIALVLTCMPAIAFAFDTFFAGPRAMGMAGANVASVNDTSAQYYNPAAYGFFGKQDNEGNRPAFDNNDLARKNWGVDVNAAGGYRLHNDFGTYIDDLSRIDQDALSAGGILNASDLQDLINLVNDLNNLDDPGNAITADMNGSFSFRKGHTGIGARIYFQTSGQVADLDRTNLGLSINGADLSADINNITVSGNDGLVSLFTPSQQAQLAAAGLDNSAIQTLDFVTRQEGVTPGEVQGVVDLLADISSQSVGTGSTLDDNTTVVLLSGFGLGEIPLTYGYALNEHLAIGGNLKLMIGRVYGTEIVVFDNDSGDVMEEARNNYEESVNLGLDAGIMSRFNGINMGLVVRNLNAPEFDGPEVKGRKFEDVTINPQVTAGVAIFPHETLTIEADLDLTKNETTLKKYDTRNFRFGMEWNVFRFLAVRGGAYKNLEEDDIGWVYTAGLGLNLWAARLDIAGAIAEEKATYDEEDIPIETRAAAQFSIDF